MCDAKTIEETIEEAGFRRIGGGTEVTLWDPPPRDKRPPLKKVTPPPRTTTISKDAFKLAKSDISTNPELDRKRLEMKLRHDRAKQEQQQRTTSS